MIECNIEGYTKGSNTKDMFPACYKERKSIATSNSIRKRMENGSVRDILCSLEILLHFLMRTYFKWQNYWKFLQINNSKISQSICEKIVINRSTQIAVYHGLSWYVANREWNFAVFINILIHFSIFNNDPFFPAITSTK